MIRLLLDQNVSYRTVKKLSIQDWDVKHVSECGLMDTDDPDIWEFAQKHGYGIVTFDADFYDLSLIKGHPPKTIWIRKGNLSTQQVVELILKHQKNISEFLTLEVFAHTACLELS